LFRSESFVLPRFLREGGSFLAFPDFWVKDRKSTLLLEYSDNREWLEGEIKPEIERRFPLVKVIMQLLSLTSAAHMGPRSWGIAFLPENPQQGDSDV
jgi:fatty acid-binding protein DegV